MHTDQDTVRQTHIHAEERVLAGQPRRDVRIEPMAKEDKKLQLGLSLQEENLVGQRICALLSWGLSDLPEPILKRIMASRNRALDLRKDFSA